MSKKLYWGLGVLMLLIIGATVFMFVRSQAEIRQLEREAADAQKQLQQSEAQQDQQVPQRESSAQGHFHDDGTFHRGEHNPLDTPTWQTPAVKMPENVKDPAVAAAWKRLADISNNRQRWGQFSPRTLELMDELTPLPELGSSEHGDCGEGIILFLDELAKLGDPRSAELLLSYEMDSGISGDPPFEALVSMGPAAIPVIIARLDDTSGETFLATPLRLLHRIVPVHHSELDGIVEHIIIPKLEEIAAVVPEGSDDFAVANKSYALKVLDAILQKPKSQ